MIYIYIFIAYPWIYIGNGGAVPAGHPAAAAVARVSRVDRLLCRHPLPAHYGEYLKRSICKAKESYLYGNRDQFEWQKLMVFIFGILLQRTMVLVPAKSQNIPLPSD